MTINNAFILLIEPNPHTGLECLKGMGTADNLIVAAVGSSENCGKDVGAIVGCPLTGIFVEETAELPQILDRTSPDLAIFCDTCCEHSPGSLQLLMEHGCAIAFIVDEDFPQPHDIETLQRIDEMALEFNVAVGCFGSARELRDEMPRLLAHAPGLIPSHLY